MKMLAIAMLAAMLSAVPAAGRAGHARLMRWGVRSGQWRAAA